MPNKLIGTGANQVPVNGMLGELAFQSKENVNFTGGTGKLSKLDIDAISAQIGVTATDIFVYDTSKDSDGGAWRKRCQHTSWYNEGLNTATRGSRREFPSIAVIVVTQNTLIIYDGDDANLPMWMSFTCTFQGYGQGSTMLGNVYGSSNVSNTLTSVCAFNGEMWVGKTGLYNNVEYSSVNFVKFIADMGGAIGQIFGNGTTVRNATFAGNIAQRNSTSIFANGVYSKYASGIATEGINDVAITALPGAPIDPLTGLPTPTIAVATKGAVSVLKDDGNTYNLSGNNWGGSALQVAFDTSGVLYFSQMSYYWMSCDVKGLTQNYNTLIDGRPYYQSAVDTYPFKQVSCYDGNGWGASIDPAVPADPNSSDFHIAHWSLYTHPYGRIVRHHINKNIDGYRGNAELMNYTAPTYNTGWMIGDTKTACLNSTVQETIVSSELITNGTFDANVSGWSGSATITWVSGKMRTTGSQDRSAAQTISTVPGKTYVLSFDVKTLSGSNSGVLVINGIQTGITAWTLGNLTSTGTYTTTFTASGTYTSIIFGNYGAGASDTAAYVEYDNVSVRLTDADRTLNNKSLQVYGTIVKTPVAAGADLMGYGGFSSSNYLQQPYNSALDFGTGDFSIMFWSRNPGNGKVFIQRCRADQEGLTSNATDLTQQIYIYTGSNNYYVTLGTSSANTGVPMPGSEWEQAVWVRRSNILYLYINGVLRYSGTNVGNIGAATHVLRIGTGINYNVSALEGNIALVRISASTPTPDQILKIYNDEKVLFQENAKASLYGTSDSLTALAYDNDTKLLHVGTSSGRSVFQGLRRIDNTTTAVTASISAANGLVAEQ